MESSYYRIRNVCKHLPAAPSPTCPEWLSSEKDLHKGSEYTPFLEGDQGGQVPLALYNGNYFWGLLQRPPAPVGRTAVIDVVCRK
jgi:hypothetical protein